MCVCVCLIACLISQLQNLSTHDGARGSVQEERAAGVTIA